MKKDLAEVKVYAKAMANSNQARDAYVDKEQDKFFHYLNRQRSNINALKEQLEQLELSVRIVTILTQFRSPIGIQHFLYALVYLISLSKFVSVPLLISASDHFWLPLRSLLFSYDSHLVYMSHPFTHIW